MNISPATMAKLAEFNGGRNITNEQELVKLIESYIAISLDGAVIILDAEDAQAMKDHFDEFNYGSYDEYVSDTVNEAIHMFLWGSSRGILAYR